MDYINAFADLFNGLLIGISIFWNALISHPWILVIIIIIVTCRFIKRR